MAAVIFAELLSVRKVSALITEVEHHPLTALRPSLPPLTPTVTSRMSLYSLHQPPGLRRGEHPGFEPRSDQQLFICQFIITLTQVVGLTPPPS